MDSRGRKAKLNILVSLANQLITLLCGFIVPRLMLEAFGSELYGASSSITQFLAYITLLEGGIGGVARAALYKPLADGDTDAISRIMAEIKVFFRVIGWIFAVYVLVLACSFQWISRVEALDWISTFALVLVISISTFGQYFIGISNAVLLQASQKSYVTHGVSLATTLLNTVCILVMVRLGFDLILVKLVSSCIFLLRPIVMWLYVKRTCRLIRCPRLRESCLPQKWDGLGQHIAYFLHSNTDIAVLTIFADLKAVAVYSVYNMVISHMQSLTASFTSGMEAMFGDMLAKRESEQLHRTFDYYETMISLVTVVLFSATSVLIVPFVDIYTRGIQDADYHAPVFAALLVLAAVLYCLRTPYHAAVVAAGHFRQTRVAAYGEAVANVVLSVLLVSRWGLVGVAVGTVLATAFRFGYYVVYLSKQILCRSMALFWKRFLVNALAYGMSVLTASAALRPFDISGYGIWAVCGALTAAICAVISVTVNLVFYRKDSRVFLKKLFRRA